MQLYSDSYEIKSYECDNTLHLKLMSVFNLFQDVADKHAEKMGVGYTFCQQRKIGWVGVNYHIRFYKRPAWREKIILSTWPSGKTAVSGIREFQMTNQKGMVLIDASSQWVLIDLQKMHPLSVRKWLPDYEIFPQRSVETTFPKRNPLSQFDFSLTIPVLKNHIDFNNHVNNAYYPVWAIDSLSEDFLRERVLSELEISFKKPALLGDEITILTKLDGNVTYHDIKKETTLLACVKCYWR